MLASDGDAQERIQPAEQRILLQEGATTMPARATDEVAIATSTRSVRACSRS